MNGRVNDLIDQSQSDDQKDRAADRKALKDAPKSDADLGQDEPHSGAQTGDPAVGGG